MSAARLYYGPCDRELPAVEAVAKQVGLRDAQVRPREMMDA
jgi:hypothetical protein